MSKKDDIEKKTEALLTPIAEANGVRVYDVEYVKEAGEWYLRAYIDKDGGVNINECVDVSHALSDALDEDDFIEEAYTLEVSSPGLGRQLKKDRHFASSIGQDPIVPALGRKHHCNQKLKRTLVFQRADAIAIHPVQPVVDLP